MNWFEYICVQWSEITHQFQVKRMWSNKICMGQNRHFSPKLLIFIQAAVTSVLISLIGLKRGDAFFTLSFFSNLEIYQEQNSLNCNLFDFSRLMSLYAMNFFSIIITLKLIYVKRFVSFAGPWLFSEIGFDVIKCPKLLKSSFLENLQMEIFLEIGSSGLL